MRNADRKMLYADGWKVWGEMFRLRPNYLGIIGAILAFVSLVLPWWAMSVSGSASGISYSGQLYLYPYQSTASELGHSVTVSANLWFGWTALVLVVIGGSLSLAGSVMYGLLFPRDLIARGRRAVLAVGGVLVLLSIIVFALGLQNQLSGSLATGYPTGVGLFSSSSYSFMGISVGYWTYLTFGFWLALAAAIIIFVAVTRKPADEKPPPKPSTPSPT
jgi:hypothetical protein